jgi:hypothetical protein
VSFLASNAAEDRHFLGSTSGVLFPNLVRASVEVTGSNPSNNFSGQGDVRVLPTTLETRSTYGASAPRESLPPESIARKLVSSYLVHDYIAYPFLLPSFILSITDFTYTDQSYYGRNPFEAFVFDMVLAIANANVYKYDWQMLPSVESHHSRAMLRIGEVLQAGGLKSLQAILLFCQYRTGSSIQDTSASIWHLVGIAGRTAYELGLHHESAYPIKDNGSLSSTLAERFRDQEIRRRCFWCTFAMDR